MPPATKKCPFCDGAGKEFHKSAYADNKPGHGIERYSGLDTSLDRDRTVRCPYCEGKRRVSYENWTIWKDDGVIDENGRPVVPD